MEGCEQKIVSEFLLVCLLVNLTKLPLVGQQPYQYNQDDQSVDVIESLKHVDPLFPFLLLFVQGIVCNSNKSDTERQSKQQLRSILVGLILLLFLQ